MSVRTIVRLAAPLVLVVLPLSLAGCERAASTGAGGVGPPATTEGEDARRPAATGGEAGVRWPASARVDWMGRLQAARRKLVPPAPGETMTLSPGVQVREGEAAGLVFLDVIMGQADFETPLPLVVLLHGRGDRPRVPGGPFGHVPTAFRLILPRAPIPLGDGYTWVRTSITDGRPEELAYELGERAQHLAAFLDRVTAERPIVGRPILAGFSQGAMVTYALAVSRPSTLAAALPLVGWLPPGLWPPEDAPVDEALPIRSVHGTLDPIIPIGPTRLFVQALRAHRWNVELREFEGVGHTMTSEMNATFEVWLEQALAAEAPGRGGGLGRPGPEATRYEPVEPSDS